MCIHTCVFEHMRFDECCVALSINSTALFLVFRDSLRYLRGPRGVLFLDLGGDCLRVMLVCDAWATGVCRIRNNNLFSDTHHTTPHHTTVICWGQSVTYPPDHLTPHDLTALFVTMFLVSCWLLFHEHCTCRMLISKCVFVCLVHVCVCEMLTDKCILRCRLWICVFFFVPRLESLTSHPGRARNQYPYTEMFQALIATSL
jgi:hypothetical protein